ncbi:hypothetical protein C8Q78DRAFT_402206 [Trametes maxima]|nr:hypothetical protein C8Q78DRAFT_402206 [Trametes maxima]
MQTFLPNPDRPPAPQERSPADHPPHVIPIHDLSIPSLISPSWGEASASSPGDRIDAGRAARGRRASANGHSPQLGPFNNNSTSQRRRTSCTVPVPLLGTSMYRASERRPVGLSRSSGHACTLRCATISVTTLNVSTSDKAKSTSTFAPRGPQVALLALCGFSVYRPAGAKFERSAAHATGAGAEAGKPNAIGRTATDGQRRPPAPFLACRPGAGCRVPSECRPQRSRSDSSRSPLASLASLLAARDTLTHISRGTQSWNIIRTRRGNKGRRVTAGQKKKYIEKRAPPGEAQTRFRRLVRLLSSRLDSSLEVPECHC